MDELLDRLVADLAAVGVDAAPVGDATPVGDIGPDAAGRATLRLSRGRSACTYTVLYGSTVPTLRVAEGDRRPVLVYTPRLGGRTADVLRRVGVQFLDADGNAWIEFADVLIDVRGRPRVRRPEVVRPSGSLFTTRRAQVVLALLAWPRLWQAPRRELADVAGVSLGQAQNTLTLLEAAGFGPERGDSARPRLLDLWAGSFPTGLAPRLLLATYSSDDVTSARPSGVSDPVFLSGAAAMAQVLRPATLTLYVADLDPKLPVANRWRVDGDPNVVVRRAFWRSPDPPAGGPDVAPWPLVYADLLADDDPRVRGSAGDWRAEHVRSA